MNRVYTSADLSLTYDVGATGSEEYKAMLQTPSGKILDVSVATSAPDITLTMDKANWPDAIGGTGFIEVRSTTGTTDAVVVSEPVRVMGGVLLDGGE